MLSENVDKCSACRYAFACDEQDEANCKGRDYNRFALDSHYIETLGPGNEKYYYRRKANKVKFEDLPIEDRITEIKHNFTQSLICIGIDPTGKNLLEVIADLANELNKTMAGLRTLEKEFHDVKYRTERS